MILRQPEMSWALARGRMGERWLIWSSGMSWYAHRTRFRCTCLIKHCQIETGVEPISTIPATSLAVQSFCYFRLKQCWSGRQLPFSDSDSMPYCSNCTSWDLSTYILAPTKFTCLRLVTRSAVRVMEESISAFQSLEDVGDSTKVSNFQGEWAQLVYIKTLTVEHCREFVQDRESCK